MSDGENADADKNGEGAESAAPSTPGETAQIIQQVALDQQSSSNNHGEQPDVSGSAITPNQTGTTGVPSTDQVAGTVPLPSGSAEGITSIVSDSLVFEINAEANTATLVGSATTAPKSDLSIPASVTSGATTYEVTAIAKNAFANCRELTSLSLPATLREVDPDALAGCPSLKFISVSFKNDTFASSDGMLFTNDYSTLLLIPEGKEGAATIPGETSSVPAQAFSRCLGIASLRTGDGGAELKAYNGMLFSKDLKTLLVCPAGAGSAAVLPAETEAIGEYALAGCKNLASITALGNVQTIESTAFADEAKTSAVVALPAGENYDARKSVWEKVGFQHFAEPAQPCLLYTSWFAEAGAPKEVLWQAKPHIGTDLLVDVVRTLRQSIIKAGGEVRFHAQVERLVCEDGVLAAVDVRDTRTGEQQRVAARRVVLACGHSARDTFEAVRDAGFRMEQKPFSVGVRIEHPQVVINRAQYGEAAAHPALGAADYKLAVHLPGGRSVYTFCMCPGGEVVCAASEPGGVVVNGMSRFARDGENANSALLVGVGPEDFESDDPLAGVELQRRMERAAYEAAVNAGGAPYTAPAQTVGDFLAKRAGDASSTVCPTYARGVAWCDLHTVLPPFVAEALAEALPLLDRKLHGFADAGAIMTGVETRSSSPVRIVRNETLQAVMDGEEKTAKLGTGLYPCGEGAGYAGGIMSAACDGLRVATALASEFESPQK